jgi:hypothetical protein
MPSLTSLKFKSNDKFANLIFIASEQSNAEMYNKLVDYNAKLVEKQYGTFLPMYHNPEYSYATIRFFKSLKFKPVEGYTYDIEFNFKIKNKDGKQFINCHLVRMSFVSKPEKVDEGEVLDLD